MFIQTLNYEERQYLDLIEQNGLFCLFSDKMRC